MREEKKKPLQFLGTEPGRRETHGDQGGDHTDDGRHFFTVLHPNHDEVRVAPQSEHVRIRRSRLRASFRHKRLQRRAS